MMTSDCDRIDLAMFLWERISDNIAAAIAASHIFLTLADKLGPHNLKLKNDYEQKRE